MDNIVVKDFDERSLEVLRALYLPSYGVQAVSITLRAGVPPVVEVSYYPEPSYEYGSGSTERSERITFGTRKDGES